MKVEDALFSSQQINVGRIFNTLVAVVGLVITRRWHCSASRAVFDVIWKEEQ